MNVQELLGEQIAKERELLMTLETGTDEYAASLDRILKLEDRLASIEKNRADMKLEYAKIGSAIATSAIGLGVILKFEETGTIRTALRGYVQNFIPKKWF